MPSFRCIETGVSCEFEAAAKTEDELMKKIAEHAPNTRNMKTIPTDAMKKVKKAIRK